MAKLPKKLARKVEHATSVDELETLIARELHSTPQLAAGVDPADLPPQAKVEQAQNAPPPPSAALELARAHAKLVEEHKGMARTVWGAVEQISVARAGDVMKLEAHEREILVDGTAPVLAKYLPQVATTPEAQLLMAVAMVFAPKVLAAWSMHQQAMMASAPATVGTPATAVAPVADAA